MKSVYRISLLGLIACAGVIALGFLWQPVTSNLEVLTNLNPLKTLVSSKTSFAVIGDNEGDNEIYRDLISQIAADSEIKFLINLGDATATGSQAEIDELLKLHQEMNLQIPVYFVPGNHDIKADPARGIWVKNFGQKWQSLDIENLHLVLLDNADRKVGFPEEELAWLENDLVNLQKRAAVDQLTVIAYHRPFNYPLAEIVGDDETMASRKSNEKFIEILRKYPPDQIFTGHIHSSADYLMPLQKNAEGQTLKSVPVMVSGGGGQPPQSALGGIFKAKYHFVKVEVEKQKIKTRVVPAR
ncbi:hypothetical protein C4546_01460 [Candidatus Parcubacteria bacterium]|jgi:predicted phosphodiesterase|nr:MAG: hypothetical protein C4546_01460 [Candidatus Parcubacteria bacterium]